MRNYTQRSAEEAKTHQLFGEYFSDEKRWSPTGAIIANVFRAMWSSALTADSICRIGVAMTNYMADQDIADLQDKLTALVKAKVLRSFVKRGERLYEVNF